MRNYLTALLVIAAYVTSLGLASACQTATPQQIENALQNAPGLNSGLNTCAMAAMAMKESGGGHTCAHNFCCDGILQVNHGPTGIDPMTTAKRLAYRNADLQTQVNGWVATANSNASSSGYKILLASYNSGQPLHGHTVTAGDLAACEQFGPGVCNANARSLQSTGACGSASDANGQTVCSWGAKTDTQAAAQTCSANSNCKANSGNAPQPPTPTTNSIIISDPSFTKS